MSDLCQLQVNGYALPAGTLNEDLRQRLCHSLEANSKAAGRRNLFDEHPESRALLKDPLIEALVHATLGPGAFVVRATLFDKRPDANWAVTWHQDQAIAVHERHEVPGYGPWSIKHGVVHVEPPAEILAAMVAVRIHLDPCPEDNGALVALPGSHQVGRTDAETYRCHHPHVQDVVLPVHAGGVLLMKPLTLHRSSKCSTGDRRRVVHLDCAAQDLAKPLRWALREPSTHDAPPR